MCSCKKKIKNCEFWQSAYRTSDLDKFVQEDSWIPYYPRIIQPVSANLANQILNLVMLGMTIPFKHYIWNLSYKVYREYYESYVDFVNFIVSRNQSSVFIDGGKQGFRPIFIQSFSRSQIPAKLIHLTRRPHDYVYSYAKVYPYLSKAFSMKMRSRNDIIAFAAKKWLSVHRKVLNLKKFILDENYYSMRYEDLCQDPNHFLAKTLRFLDVEYENLQQPVIYPEKFHLIGSQSIQKHGFDGVIKLSTHTADLSTEEIKIIDRITQPFSARFGYV
ncbi:hypothetical protein C1752_00920 [Acaryochloris thomasi RCC1774]|uniref:Sulfotransferase domain-containing protein n=2 Tax=Acaryochloris TaxID=155977 RepID=A0A2W1JZ21_9CYAN|nr:hypothetical protein C1752_00920 [Acaryochloris thomasi RCC1774]